MTAATQNYVEQLREERDELLRWKEIVSNSSELLRLKTKAEDERDAALKRANRDSTGFRAMCEAWQRLEEIVGLDTGGGMGPAPALNAVEQILRERLALAAHVEKSVSLNKEGSDNALNDGFDWQDWNKRMQSFLAEAPATTLARRDLVKLAEGLEEESDNVGYWAGVRLRERANELRQQAAGLT